MYGVILCFQIDLTKTSDGKGSFLSVLAKAVWNKYPETIAFRLHLPSLNEAVKGICCFLCVCRLK